MLCRERTIQSYLQKTNLLPLCIQIIYNLFQRFAYRTHGNHHVFRICGTVIVKRLVISACEFGDLAHIFFYHVYDICVVHIACFSGLEEDIGVLCSPFYSRIHWIQAAFAEILHCIHIY